MTDLDCTRTEALRTREAGSPNSAQIQGPLLLGAQAKIPLSQLCPGASACPSGSMRSASRIHDGRVPDSAFWVVGTVGSRRSEAS